MGNPPRGKLTRRGALFLLVYALVLAGCGYTGFRVLFLTGEQDRGEAAYAQFRLEKHPVDTEVPGTRPAAITLPLPEECAEVRALQAEYPELAAWITIPNTVVDYPVMQGEDNQKYLDHMPDGTQNTVGSIFMDCRNALDDQHLILYGHNVGKGTMFGSLKKYRDEAYYAERPQFTLVTADKVYLCEIFSVRTVNAYDSGVYRTEFSDEEDFAAYAAQCKEDSLYEIPVTPGPGDEIITLSTCTGGERTARFVVQARVATG